MRRVLICAGLATSALLVAAPSASATTFCVEKPACVAAGGTNQPTLTAAITASNAAANADRIELGAGNFGGGQTVTQPVDIVGEGPSTTTISTGGTTILTIGNGPSTVSALRIYVDGELRGLDMTVGSASASGIKVDGGPGAGAETGVRLGNGASLTDSEVTMESSTLDDSTGVRAINGTVTRTRIEGEIGLEGSGTHRRLSVLASATGIRTDNSGGSLTVDQATVRMTEAGTAISAVGGLFGANLTARHVTAVGNGTGTGANAAAACFTDLASPAAINLRNSILRAFATDRARSGVADCNVGAPVVPSAAAFDSAHSIFDPAKTTDNGPGGFAENGAPIAAGSLGATNLNADPLFVNAGAGDFHLALGSPAIDAGDPAAPGAGESTEDLDGLSRVADGNGDGIGRRDIGAFERAAPATGGDGGGGGGDGDGGGGGGGNGTTEITRSLTLGYKDKADEFKGVLKSNEAGCLSGKVKVYEKRKGKDPKVGSDKTNAKGNWSFEERNPDGRFVAKVDEKTVPAGTCPAARSRTKGVG